MRILFSYPEKNERCSLCWNGFYFWEKGLTHSGLSAQAEKVHLFHRKCLEKIPASQEFFCPLCRKKISSIFPPLLKREIAAAVWVHCRYAAFLRINFGFLRMVIENVLLFASSVKEIEAVKKRSGESFAKLGFGMMMGSALTDLFDVLDRPLKKGEFSIVITSIVGVFLNILRLEKEGIVTLEFFYLFFGSLLGAFCSADLQIQNSSIKTFSIATALLITATVGEKGFQGEGRNFIVGLVCGFLAVLSSYRIKKWFQEEKIDLFSIKLATASSLIAHAVLPYWIRSSFFSSTTVFLSAGISGSLAGLIYQVRFFLKVIKR